MKTHRHYHQKPVRLRGLRISPAERAELRGMASKGWSLELIVEKSGLPRETVVELLAGAVPARQESDSGARRR